MSHFTNALKRLNMCHDGVILIGAGFRKSSEKDDSWTFSYEKIS